MKRPVAIRNIRMWQLAVKVIAVQINVSPPGGEGCSHCAIFAPDGYCRQWLCASKEGRGHFFAIDFISCRGHWVCRDRWQATETLRRGPTAIRTRCQLVGGPKRASPALHPTAQSQCVSAWADPSGRRLKCATSAKAATAASESNAPNFTQHLGLGTVVTDSSVARRHLPTSLAAAGRQQQAPLIRRSAQRQIEKNKKKQNRQVWWKFCKSPRKFLHWTNVSSKLLSERASASQSSSTMCVEGCRQSLSSLSVSMQMNSIFSSSFSLDYPPSGSSFFIGCFRSRVSDSEIFTFYVRGRSKSVSHWEEQKRVAAT